MACAWDAATPRVSRTRCAICASSPCCSWAWPTATDRACAAVSDNPSFATIPSSSMSDVQQRIADLVKSNRVMLFMKGTAQFPMCGFSGRAIQILKAAGATDIKTFNVLEDEEVRQGIKDYANWPTIPQLYINGEFVGGSDIMMEMYESGELQQALTQG
mmetsp:Transcript_53750/g.126711  ORF Transcript_53750/g.126711 Transcript_53750/m.126711 type:complete len:159 (-) Transcript_53750:833-1309(-)